MTNATDDRNTKYVRFIFDTEKRYREWLAEAPTEMDEYMIRNNVRTCDRTFDLLDKHCNAPDCRYPLRKDSPAESLPFIGDVCNLCYFMYHVVAARRFFLDAQKQDNENDPSKRKR